VTADEMLRFPEGQELRIGASTPGAAGGRRAKLARAGGLLRRDGLVRGGGKVLKRGTKKVVRMLRSAAK
jgi:hypothetical protein